MSEFKGTLGFGGILVTLSVLVIGVVFFILCWNLYFLAGEKQFAIFSGTMLGSLCVFLLALPMLSTKIEDWCGDGFNDFLALPDKDTKITYPVLSQFLGEQALAGFMGSAMMLSARSVLDHFGVGFTGFYCFAILMIALSVATISLVRFILHFVKFRWRYYVPASLISLLTMLCALAVGLKSVTP
ncbi:hypothetical protein ATI02_4013 [Pseudomonas baetica]|uniref:Uncharacterized protein n=1 Tax=Pseudomonas baetica TaxID=674054 RepID=A0ABX4Q2Q9_9PSED|nr:hypothetical protein [Pseudomonas baetica]PKA71061.1 hypothetical protein ATI02_4013 [Pseudomonas baetica]PTC15965.1 hypothetical protein C0J26_26895 [Pseudomonas baetica]